MSDGLPAGAMSLEPTEENADIVGVIADPNVPVGDQGDGDAEPEGVVTTPTGVKMVPIQALHETRAKLKESKATIAAKETEYATVKAKADRYDQVEPQIRAAMPIIEGIQRRPDLVAQLNQPAPRQVEPIGPLDPNEAIEYAKDFDLYKPDGTPDTDRAQRIAKRHEAMNARSTANAIAPFAMNEAQRQSQSMLVQVANYRDPSGMAVDQNILKAIWEKVPAEMSAKPEVAGVLYRMALAEQIIQGKMPKPGPGPVLQTEGVGQRVAPQTTITQIDENIMKHAGISKKDYTDTAARFKPGQSNFLE